jgi:hypothetical protein
LTAVLAGPASASAGTRLSGTAPTITSADATTFTTRTAGTFTVTTTGSPTPSLTEKGKLPAGVTFTDNGNGTATLAGTPSGKTGGSYPLTITASNGVPPKATQKFTLSVDQPPAITSADSTAFVAGMAGTFTVTTIGYPAPSLGENGGLPPGIGFTDNGNGTATIAGTGTAAGAYSIVITARNGVGTPATQDFTLDIDQHPAITSANHTDFTAGTAESFEVTTTGFPLSALVEAGPLPTGITFTDNGNGTATLGGTASETGVFPITITAINGV